jgi:hypothetical protein
LGRQERGRIGHTTYLFISKERLTHTKEKKEPTNEREENYVACPPSLSLEMADITIPPEEVFLALTPDLIMRFEVNRLRVEIHRRSSKQ